MIIFLNMLAALYDLRPSAHACMSSYILMVAINACCKAYMLMVGLPQNKPCLSDMFIHKEFTLLIDSYNVVLVTV